MTPEEEQEARQLMRSMDEGYDIPNNERFLPNKQMHACLICGNPTRFLSQVHGYCIRYQNRTSKRGSAGQKSGNSSS